MKIENFKKIVISFERPKDSKKTIYEFIKNPPINQGGGLHDQIVMVKEEFSLNDIVETFIEVSDNLSDLISEEYAYLIATILSLSWNSASIKLFPDEYKEVLDLIKETEDGYILNQEKLNILIKSDDNILKILEALINEKFLRKNAKGEYIVRKKLLTNIHVSFIQIAE